jgi:hypothetical protein
MMVAMTIMLLGQVVRPEGMTLHANALGEVDDAAVIPAVAFMRRQPADLGVHFDHDQTWRLGRVSYLERSDRHGLMAMATIDADIGDLLDEHGPWYWSDGITCKRLGQSIYRHQAQLREISLVRRSGNCGTPPVVWSPHSGEPPMPLLWRSTWQRGLAAIAYAKYHRSDTLDIVDRDPLGIVDEVMTDPDTARAKARAADEKAKARAKVAVKARSTAPTSRSTSLEGRTLWDLLDAGLA